MSNINDETVRAKMRKLRVSTFADVFYEICLLYTSDAADDQSTV